MISPSKNQLRELWSQVVAASDPAERDDILMKFRDALHELLAQVREESKKPPWPEPISALLGFWLRRGNFRFESNPFAFACRVDGNSKRVYS